MRTHIVWGLHIIGSVFIERVYIKIHIVGRNVVRRLDSSGIMGYRYQVECAFNPATIPSGLLNDSSQDVPRVNVAKINSGNIG